MTDFTPSILIVGVGGAGNHIVTRLSENGLLNDVQALGTLGIDTNVQNLNNTTCDTKLAIGKKVCKGLGAGKDPKRGKAAAKESITEIRNHIQADIVFLIVGLGGGTGKEPRNPEYRTAKKLLEVLDKALARAKQEYTDLWRITVYEPGGRHSFNTSCEVIEALEKAKKQGKTRFTGISSHDRRWFKFMIEYFPGLEVVLFPFTTMSKRAPKDSLFDALKKCDVGAFGIKPYAAGSLFQGSQQENDQRARLALRYILHSNTVMSIPGINNVHQVDIVAKAVKERHKLDLKEKVELDKAGGEAWAKLPTNYQWLRNWEYV